MASNHLKKQYQCILVIFKAAHLIIIIPPLQDRLSYTYAALPQSSLETFCAGSRVSSNLELCMAEVVCS